ncbi:MAG: hypothetical protein WBA22_16670 [Candidatus Methanofastidiosia archaeon]
MIADWMKISDIPLKVVRGDGDMFGELLKSLAHTEATQVLVTGADAFRTVADRVDFMIATLGQNWTALSCQHAPARADIRSLIQKFALAIDHDPSQRRICFGPVSPEVVLGYLFTLSKNGYYKAGIYVLGLFDPPIGPLFQLSSAIGAPGKAPGSLESIISAEDNCLLISEQEELKALIDCGGDARNKLRNIMTSRQEQVEKEEKALRAPLSPARAGVLAKLFRRKSIEDSWTTLTEAERRRRGLLPPPQNIAINYKCECGVYLSVNLKNFNIFGGVEVTCAHCGAVCFIPPEILDHTRYDPSNGGATLREDYQNLLRFVRHRSRAR